MFIFLLIVSIAIILFFYSTRILSKKNQNIVFIKERVNQCLDSRFRLFELLIAELQKVDSYESTILKDLAQYRMQAQHAKLKESIALQLSYENKISKVVENLDTLFEEYALPNKISNLEKYKVDILLAENNLNLLKQEYNIAIEDYNKTKGKFPYILYNIYPNFAPMSLRKEFEYWK